MSAAQRASLEAVEAADRSAGGGARGSIAGGLGGILGTGGAGDEGRERAGSGVWDAVKGFATAAGQKAVELEEVAWKKVNGK